MGTVAVVAASIAGALALVLAAIVMGVLLRYADDGAAQSACQQSGGPPGALVSEAAQPVGELSAWPLGLRCVFPEADGGNIAVAPDFSLTFVAIAGVALAVVCGAAWTFGRERRRLASHHRVLERRSDKR